MVWTTHGSSYIGMTRLLDLLAVSPADNPAIYQQLVKGSAAIAATLWAGRRTNFAKPS